MYEISSFMKEIGRLSLDTYWFPLLIWSACALLIHLGLKWMERSDVLYQYHLRVALVAGIPLGILLSLVVKYTSQLFTTTAPTGALSIIVVQNPLTVVPAAPATISINWSDPYLWIGIVTLVLTIAGLLQLLRMIANYYQVSSYAQRLDTIDIREMNQANPEELQSEKPFLQQTLVAFSGETEVPFTFGWRRPIVVIPNFLKEKPEQLRMALRHELMHIKRGDFLVNGFVTAMKRLFWFHPLLHIFDNEIREYREISCDSEVLADRSISRKEYARLLFELAPRNEQYSRNVVSMAVNQSSLKKRIHNMKNATSTHRPVMKSVLISLGLLIGISGFIACSDLSDSGVTNRDIQNMQTQMQGADEEEQPLFVFQEDKDLDGTPENKEVIPKSEGPVLSRVSPQDIKSIEVLKGEEAVREYGDEGTNGVIIVTVFDKEKALQGTTGSSSTDVRPTGYGSSDTAEQKDFFVVVEEMPQLKGGLETIQECVEYPEMARNAEIEGRVIIRFIVNKQGRIENPEVMKSIGQSADEEALRCVRQAEFIPGKQRGNPVRVQYALPVIFKLPNAETSSSVNVENPEVEGKMMAVDLISGSSDGMLSGKILDEETGSPLAGVNIVIQGTSIGTVTDSNGKFNLDFRSASSASTLVFSYIGYKTHTLEIQNE